MHDKTDSAPVRLNSHHAILLHAVACILFVSGGIASIPNLIELLDYDYFLEPGIKHWALRVHGGAAMVFLVVLGTLLPTHVRAAWTSGRNRISGSILLCVLGSLAITGYGLYYIGGEWLRATTVLLHLGLGFADPFIFISHLLLGRRTRQKELVLESANTLN